MKNMNLLKLTTHTDCGADSATLQKLHCSHVRSKLDYGYNVHGSARILYLPALDQVQNGALCLGLGTFTTTPTPSFRVEANELPVPSNLKREKLTLKLTNAVVLYQGVYYLTV